MGAEFSTFVNPIRANKFAALMVASPVMLSRASDRAVERAAVWLAGKVRTGIRNQSPGGRPFLPLKAATIKAKGSSKALIDLGDLRRSIKSQKIATSTYVVGVHRTARNKSGTKLVLIGKVHEEGYPPGATGQPSPVATGIDRVNIPARPYLAPTFVRHEDEIVEMVGKQTGAEFFEAF